MTLTSSGSWSAPPNLAAAPRVQAWGESGAASAGVNATHSGAGAGSGAYAEEPALGGISAGVTTLTIVIGAGGTGTNTTVTGGSVTVQANAGGSASTITPGNGGTAGSNTIAWAGAAGGAGVNGTSKTGGGGGGSPGTTGSGTAGTGGASGGAGGSAGSGTGGAAGGAGGAPASGGGAGTVPGSGPGGGGDTGGQTAGTPASGQVIITWTVITYSASGYAAAAALMSGAHAAVSAFKAYISAPLATPNVTVVNQWTGTFAQPAVAGNTPPALQSTVIALTPVESTGLGSGVPTAGNWLWCVAGWNQSGLPPVTVGDADDTHSFWRPGNVTTSTWAVSPSAANTRVSVWYTANLARAPGDVYAAPSGAMAGMAVTVLEVANLGPWDTVTGINVGYAAAATSLGLSLTAPSAPAFVLAAVCGDSSAATQALNPGSPWRALPSVTASNGVDHTCDAVLNVAALSSTSSSVSISATAGSATDLAGVIIGVQIAAPSPIPAGANTAWPGRTILEAAFGSGFQTPADQMTWTVLSDNAWASMSDGYKRFWSFSDRSGVPYALGQLQSAEGSMQLDNADGALSPSNALSPFYPDVTTGTPVRLRVALGSIGGTAYNRWYTLSRYSVAWPEKRNKALRGFVEMTTSDIWSVMSGACPTPYRGEVEQDSPAAWYPMDDQPLTGGVQPVHLRNAAKGNTTPLAITISPNGTGPDNGYGTDGVAAGVYGYTVGTPVGLTSYTAGADAGWMYGDPQSGQQSAQSGNPVTSQPGSAAYEQTGASGNTGSKGWILSATSASYPALSSGITLEGWFNYPYFGSQAAFSQAGIHVFAQQPYCALSLLTITTGSAPTAVLQLDVSGHLQLVTYSSGTPTTHSVWTSTDLRQAGWFHVAVTLTQTAWTVYLNGGVTAVVSGSASSMTSAWSWLVVNGDMGTSGGGTNSAIVHGANVAAAHVAVYPAVLPPWRVMAHYWAACTGFGQIPAPTGLGLKFISTTGGPTLMPDGQMETGTYGVNNTNFTFSALAVAQVGSYTSGPSARVVSGSLGASSVTLGFAACPSWSAFAPSVALYTASATGVETQAAVTMGPGEVLQSGYGSGTTATGIGHLSGGSGASPPTAASSIGDTVQQRIERILGYAGITVPNRAIDSSANLLVSAALDIGGAQPGASLQNIVDSDNGLLFTDGNGTLCYRSRPHLASDTPVWEIGMDVISGYFPFDDTITWSSDPQRIFNVISLTPYAPDGSTLASLTPSNATAVAASQAQFGPRPKPLTSYLQDQSKIQAAADWWLTTFGSLNRRADVIVLDAATHPAAWPLVLSCQPGDVVTVLDMPMGAPSTTGNYRVSQIARDVSYGANKSQVQGRIALVLDALPPNGYWS